MSYQAKETVLQVLHGIVAIDYVLLAVVFAGIFTLVLSSLNGGRAQIRPWMLASVFLGSALFLAGCGIHHAHVALETIPQAVAQGPLATDVFVGDEGFTHHVVIQAAQIIGAPMVLLAGWSIFRTYRQQP